MVLKTNVEEKKELKFQFQINISQGPFKCPLRVKDTYAHQYLRDKPEM